MLKIFVLQSWGKSAAPRSSIRSCLSHSFMSPITDTGNPQGYRYPNLRIRVRCSRISFLSFVLLPPTPSLKMSSPFYSLLSQLLIICSGKVKKKKKKTLWYLKT